MATSPCGSSGSKSLVLRPVALVSEYAVRAGCAAADGRRGPGRAGLCPAWECPGLFGAGLRRFLVIVSMSFSDAIAGEQKKQ